MTRARPADQPAGPAYAWASVTRISDLLSAGRTYSFEFFPPKSDQELLVPCVACYSRFKAVEKEVKEHSRKVSFPYQGNVPIRYALDLFCDEAILEEVKKSERNLSQDLKWRAIMDASRFGPQR